MENLVDNLGLPLEVESEDGKSYILTAFEATQEGLDFIWEKAGKFQFLSSDHTRDNKDQFVEYILSPGTIILLVLEANANELKPQSPAAVGIIHFDNIRPELDAEVHYLFWDKIQRGRQRVLMSAANWAFEQLNFHRLRIEIPEYAYAALRRMYRMGARVEGRIRSCVLKDGKWHNAILFGVLKEELTSEAIEAAQLSRTDEEASWFGLLDDDSIFSRAVLKEH